MSRKNIIIILITIIIVIACLMIFYFIATKNIHLLPIPTLDSQPTQQPAIQSTDEGILWQIYENKQYGFKLKYPNMWNISNRDVDLYGGILSLVFRSPKNQKLINQAQAKIDAGQGEYGAYDAYFFNNDLEITIFHKKPIPDNNPVDQIIGKTTLGGKNAIEYWMGGYGNNYGLIIENNGIFFQFEFKGCDTEECIKNRALSIELNQILNSFEFTK